MNPEKHKFIMSWARFVTVCLYLAVVNFICTPDQPWILWVLGGWGISQLLRSADYYLKTRTE